MKPKSYIVWMAWRHLSSKKGRSLSFLTMTSIAGVTVGVAALVAVLSVMGGFEKDLMKRMFSGLPHVELLSKESLQGFSLQKYPVSRFRELLPEVVAWEPFTQADIVLKNKKYLASATLFGIDPKLGGKLWGFSQGIKEGELSHLSSMIRPEGLGSSLSSDFDAGDGKEGIILGESLATQLGVSLWDEIDVISPYAGLGDVLSGSKLSQRFRVVAIFSTDLPNYDSKYAVVSLKSGRQFLADYDESLDEEEYVSGIAFNFEDPSQVDQRLAKVLKKFPELQTLTWKDVNKSLLFALKLEKFTMGAILLLIVLVAAFSISGTMMMTVFHKRGQIALLRSLGMSRVDIARLFLLYGLSIATVGVLAGLVLGLLLCFGIFQFVDLPLGVYYQNKVPVSFLPVEYMVIAFCAWMLSLLASLYPALTASKQDPGIGLRCM
ncbi:MAG: ABC transporter permease [Oligoflexales bacterium]|nr:ABC transporter permease [Oligoflexales bacterium]